MRSALSLRPFRRLATAYTLNELGDWLATIALAVLVYDETGDALATTALFLAAKFLPAFFVPVATARVERLSTARALSVLYAGQAVALAALAAAALTFSLPLVCALAFLVGTIATTGRAVTRAATVAVLEPRDLLREGNAALNFGFAAMNVAGPALAGAVVAATSPATVLGVAAAVFLWLTVVLALARDLPHGTTDETPWLVRLRAGATYVRTHRMVRALIAGQAAVLLLATIVVPIEVVYAKESLDAGDAGYGTLVTGWGAGIVVGSLLFARFKDQPLGVLVAVSTVGIGAGYLGMAAAPGLAVATLAAAVGGIGNGIQWVAVVTAMQESVSSEMQARVAGFYEAVCAAVPGLGFVAGGLLAATLSPRAAFTVSGAGVVGIVALGALAWRIRRGEGRTAADVLSSGPTLGGGREPAADVAG